MKRNIDAKKEAAYSCSGSAGILAACLWCLSLPVLSYPQTFANSRPVMPEHTNNYLIVANPEVVSWLSEFVAYRSEDYTVRVANTAVIGNTKAQIRAYIQAQYDNIATRPEYLLLAMYRGDNRSHAIPWFDSTTYYVWEAGPGIIPSYNWYSLLAGEDLIPDVYMGIIFLENKTEADNLLFKIKATEANGFSNPKNTGYFMSLGWEMVAEWAPMAATAGYTQYSYHVPDDGGNRDTTTNAFAQLLKNNLKLYYLNGHGAPSGLVGIWATWALEAKVSNTVFPLAFSGACNTGSWCLNDTVEMDVFPEAMVLKSKDLAVAMMANSWYGGDYDKPMYHEIFRSHQLDGVSQVGKLAHCAKIKCLDTSHVYATPYYAHNFEMVHLWGDPATELNGRSSSRPRKLLHVVFGSGDGYYAIGQIVTITADVPNNSSFVFDRWAGDTGVVVDRAASRTTVTVPDHDVLVEAVYKVVKIHAVPGAIEAENANQRQGGIPAGMDAPAVSLVLGGNRFNYTVDVKTSGRYSCAIRYSTLYKPGHITLLDAAANTELCRDTLPVVGSVRWYDWGTFIDRTIKKQFNLSSGSHTLQLRIDSGTLECDRLTFTFVSSPIDVRLQDTFSELRTFDVATEGSHIMYRVPAMPGRNVSPIRLSLYSMQGRLIAHLVDEMKMPGAYSVAIPDIKGAAGTLAKGTHICVLQSGGFRKSILLNAAVFR